MSEIDIFLFSFNYLEAFLLAELWAFLFVELFNLVEQQVFDYNINLISNY